MNSQRLNILLLPRWYPNETDPQLGVFIQKHARAIALNHSITVFYAQPYTKELESYTTNDGVKEYRYYYKYNSSPLGSLINGYRYFKCWLKFKRDVKLYKKDGYKPDLFHAYIFLRTILIIWYEKLYHRIPYVYSEQWSGLLSGKINDYSFLRRWLLKRNFKKAAAVSAVSQALAKQIQAFSGRNDLQVIRNTVEPTDLSQRNKENEKIKILLVADLVDEIKNISDVIKAIHTISKETSHLELRIVGGGTDEQKLKQLANDLQLLDSVIYFDGKMDNRGVYDKLLQSDFLVVNSKFETFSLICAEALVCGIPVIATRCGGPEEIVSEESGILIPVDDIEALKNAIRKMMTEYKKYSSTKLATIASTRFSLSKAAEGFSILYHEALAADFIRQKR
jgi:glycosyltransferase involved in cell wall biosynthesis